ncbi:class F sortase, partial [Streptomyces sp. SID2131]|nr:class F sortase [Streptomyces sp. SID2131]
MSPGTRPAGAGRLLTGAAWSLLLLGLWLWGGGAVEDSPG